MEKPLLKLRPSYMNALGPIILKNLFYYSMILGILFGLTYALLIINIIKLPINIIIIFYLILLLVLSFGTIFIRLIILSNTTYYFFRTHVLHEFRFIRINRKSVPYNQIVNVSTQITLWDRLCKAGDLIIHTAEDKSPDLHLYYVKNPESVEKNIYHMIRRTTRGRRHHH